MEQQYDHGVLTESGTNEFEMLSFSIDNHVYGVNVSKVREIIRYQEITPIPGSDERVLGITMPRDEIITVVDLRKCLFGVSSEPSKEDFFIVCHFNGITTAFQVDSVSDIRRYNWNNILPADSVLNSDDTTITGVIKNDEKIICVLDFEKLMTDIDTQNGLTIDDLNKISQDRVEEARASKIRVLLAEDSKMLNKLITESITKAGYEITSCFDGQAALSELQANIASEKAHHYDVIISDIEMPQMDGMRFCKLIKEDERYKKIPFIFFSSLIDEQMQKKCMSVGGDYCMSKPQIGEVIDVIHSLIK